MFKKILIVSVLILVNFAIMAQNRKIAVFDPVGDVASHIKEIVREEISSSIMNIGGYTVLERSLIDKVLEENKFQMSGMVDDSQVSEVGKLMGANYVFVTTITPINTNYHISCKMTEVSTGRIDKQTTVQTTRGGMSDLIIAVHKAIDEMFQKETELTLQGRKIFANNFQLDDKKIQSLMANTEALTFYNKSKSQRKTGTTLLWTGVAAIVAGIGYDVLTGNIYNDEYIQKGNSIYYRKTLNLRGTVIGGVAGVALIGSGIVLRNTSKSTLKKSVDMYNSNKKTTLTIIQFGFTGNGIGLAINF